MEFLEGFWSNILYQHIENKKPIPEILSGLKPLKDYKNKVEGPGINYSGIYIMTEPVKEAQIIDVIEQIRNDGGIISKLVEIKKKHNELVEKSKQIASRFELISRKIKYKKYTTKAHCCPKEE